MPKFKKNISKFQMSGWSGWRQGNPKPPFKFLGGIGRALGGILGGGRGRGNVDSVAARQRSGLQDFIQGGLGGTFPPGGAADQTTPTGVWGGGVGSGMLKKKKKKK